MRTGGAGQVRHDAELYGVEIVCQRVACRRQLDRRFVLTASTEDICVLACRHGRDLEVDPLIGIT